LIVGGRSAASATDRFRYFGGEIRDRAPQDLPTDSSNASSPKNQVKTVGLLVNP